jgi:hypothetical protein
VQELDYCLMTDDFEEAMRLADGFLADPDHKSYVDRVSYQRAISLAERSRPEPEHRSSAISALEETLRLAELPTGGLGEEDQLGVELLLAQLHLEAQEWDDAAAALSRAQDRIDRVLRDDGTVRTELLARRDALVGFLTITGEATPEEKSRALEGMRAAFDSLLDEWRSVPPRPGGIGFLHVTRKQMVLELLLRATLLVDGSPKGSQRAIEDLMRAQAPGSLARRLQVRDAVTFDELRARYVRPGQGLLVYYPSTVRGLVFGIDAGGIRVAELEPWLVLRAAREAFLQEIERRPDGQQDGWMPSARARDMVDLLLPEALRPMVAEWDALTLVGLDLLGWVPFAALPFPEDRPMGWNVAIDALPSLPLGVRLAEREEERDPTSGIVFLGAPACAESYGLEDLRPRLNEEHLDALRNAAAGRELRIHLGRDADRSKLDADSLRDVALLHILTHGVFDLTEDDAGRLRERPASLLLAASGGGDDALLNCEEVEAWSGMPPVVLLSACGTARGPLRQGEDGVGHLGGAFLAAGASAVVLSRAQLDHDATFELTTRFTSHLARGEVSPARALQRARSELVSEHPEWSHPYYHGLLQVLGRGQDPVRMPSFPRSSAGQAPWPLVIAAGAVLLVLSWLALRGRRRATPG